MVYSMQVFEVVTCCFHLVLLHLHHDQTTFVFLMEIFTELLRRSRMGIKFLNAVAVESEECLVLLDHKLKEFSGNTLEIFPHSVNSYICQCESFATSNHLHTVLPLAEQFLSILGWVL
jgi:hypothetical protein